METKSTKLPDMRRIDEMDQMAIDRAVADGYRFVDTIYEYEMPILNLSFDVRLATLHDLYPCIKIGLSELRHSRFYTDTAIPFDVAQQIYRERITYAFERAIIFVAETTDCVIGFCALTDNTIDLIAVGKQYQRQSVGKVLVERCIAKCTKDGYETLCVATQGSNEEARRFYEKCGFQRVNIKKDFHNDNH